MTSTISIGWQLHPRFFGPPLANPLPPLPVTIACRLWTQLVLAFLNFAKLRLNRASQLPLAIPVDDERYQHRFVPMLHSFGYLLYLGWSIGIFDRLTWSPSPDKLAFAFD